MNTNNYCVIMSGGVGSRFWPFSTETRPKQFLDFFGTGKTLLQNTFERFARIIPQENIFIVTNENYAKLTKEQLPQLSDDQLLLEPMRRNTAPAIAFATYRIKAINPNANIVVAPSDHLILKEDIFLDEIQKGLEFVSTNNVLLTLGITPSRPETGYGYIQVDKAEEKDSIHKVKTFTEKPSLEIAKAFLESGEFVWNAGIFMWNVNSIIEAFAKYHPEITNRFGAGESFFNTPYEREFIEKTFPFCSNISIDYGVLEKADNVYVDRCEFGWSDLGTWGSLHDISGKDSSGNAHVHCLAMFVESTNNMVATRGDKLVVIQGLDDYIVVESDKVLMICQKSEEQRIKHFVNDVKFRFGDDFI